MKTKKLKAFTLVECIVAMALVGVISLLMAQIYSSVCQLNTNNHKLNRSLEAQMMIVEKELKEDTTNTVTVKHISSYQSTDTTAPTGEMNKIDGVTFKATTTANGKTMNDIHEKDAAKVDIYIITADGANANNMDDEIRYKFMLPAQYSYKLD